MLVSAFLHASAHVPAFEDDLLEQDVVGKSWGVYRELDKDESMLLRLNVAKGEELSFSVNLLGSANFVPGTDYVNVTLYRVQRMGQTPGRRTRPAAGLPRRHCRQRLSLRTLRRRTLQVSGRLQGGRRGRRYL